MGKSHDADEGSRSLRRWALLCYAGVIAIPVAIYFLYLLGEIFPLIITPWSAGEMLSYCGTLVAAAIAILGVYWGLRFSKQAQERQIRDEAAPFFSAVFLTQRNKRSAFGEAMRGRLY